MASKSTHLTAAALSTLAGLHVAWGRGSSFPFATRGELADAVVGTNEVPGPVACYVVASALAAAAAVLENVPPLPARLRRPGLLATAGIIGLRGVVGLAGRRHGLTRKFLTSFRPPGPADLLAPLPRSGRRDLARIAAAAASGSTSRLVCVTSRHGCPWPLAPSLAAPE